MVLLLFLLTIFTFFNFWQLPIRMLTRSYGHIPGMAYTWHAIFDVMYILYVCMFYENLAKVSWMYTIIHSVVSTYYFLSLYCQTPRALLLLSLFSTCDVSWQCHISNLQAQCFFRRAYLRLSHHLLCWQFQWMLKRLTLVLPFNFVHFVQSFAPFWSICITNFLSLLSRCYL